MDFFMEHYPYGSRRDVEELLNRCPDATEEDMKQLFIIVGPDLERLYSSTNILRLIESSIHTRIFFRETEKLKGRTHVEAGPLLHVHSVHVLPKSPENGPLLVYGTIRVQYKHNISGEEMQLDVYRRSAKDADYISPSGGDLILLRPDTYHNDYDDLWMTLHGTTMEVDLYIRIGDGVFSFAQEKFLVGGTTEGDFEELRSKEFHSTLCSATLSYIKMPFAALCEVDLRFSSRNEGLVVNVAGKIVARYKNTCGNYSSEPCVLFEKQNGFEPVKMDKLLCMSRRLLGLPAYSSLEVDLDLTYFNTSEKHIKKKIELFNRNGPYPNDYAEAVEGDFAIIVDAGLFEYPHRNNVWSGWDEDESNVESSFSNIGNPRCQDQDRKSMLIPSGSAVFYSIFIGRKTMGATLNIFGTVEFSSDDNTHYLFKRTCNDGVEIEDSQKVLPLGDVHMSFDKDSIFELKVDLKDVGGKFQNRGFATRLLGYDTQSCSVFPGKEGFCALHYSIFSRAIQAKIKIVFTKKSDHFGLDIFGSALARYSHFDYSTEFKKNYFQSVLFKRAEKDSVRLKNNGRVPLSRCVVAVPMDSSLVIDVEFFGTPFTNHFSCIQEFKIGRSYFKKMENDYALEIRLTWSDGPFMT